MVSTTWTAGIFSPLDDLVVHGNAAAVVDDGDGVVDVDGDVDAGGVAAERLVDRVVDDLIDQVMQTHLAGRADVHGGTQPDRRQTFEDGDVLGRVAAALFFPGRSVLDFDSFELLKSAFSGDCSRCHVSPSSGC